MVVPASPGRLGFSEAFLGDVLCAPEPDLWTEHTAGRSHEGPRRSGARGLAAVAAVGEECQESVVIWSSCAQMGEVIVGWWVGCRLGFRPDSLSSPYIVLSRLSVFLRTAGSRLDLRTWCPSEHPLRNVVLCLVC